MSPTPLHRAHAGRNESELLWLHDNAGEQAVNTGEEQADGQHGRRTGWGGREQSCSRRGDKGGGVVALVN